MQVADFYCGKTFPPVCHRRSAKKEAGSRGEARLGRIFHNLTRAAMDRWISPNEVAVLGLAFHEHRHEQKQAHNFTNPRAI
jgi:hypothetical protein